MVSLHHSDYEIRASSSTISAQDTIFTLDFSFTVFKVDAMIGAGWNASTTPFAKLLHDLDFTTFLLQFGP